MLSLLVNKTFIHWIAPPWLGTQIRYALLSLAYEPFEECIRAGGYSKSVQPPNWSEFTASTKVVTRPACAAQTQAIVAKHVTGCFIFNNFAPTTLLVLMCS